MQMLFEEDVNVDCVKDTQGRYRTITSVVSVNEGDDATLVYTNAPSVFPAPYYASQCNTTLATPEESGRYAYYDTNFNAYLMMRVLEGGDASWVPVNKVVWGVDTLKTSCTTIDACSTGPVVDEEGESHYVNPSWIASGTVTPPAVDAVWQEKAVPPHWVDIAQESKEMDLVQGHFMQYSPGGQQTASDFWFFCPLSSGFGEGELAAVDTGISVIDASDLS